MTTKSDFAQKLLHDLRLRKEKMAAAQNLSRQSSQTSRVTHGNSGQTSRSTRRVNTLESASTISGKTSRRSNGSSRSVNIKESSNQIVLYEGGQSSRQVRDLSMAIAFAFENSGNLTKIGTSTTNPLVNFFNRFGRRSPNSQKMEITTFSNQSLSTDQFPTVSHIHVTEISNGVHKLNQILRACSNGLNFDRNSIEVGKELLKGATDLEEALRMLVNLQDSSQYINGSQKNSRIKLLDEDEDDQEDKNKQENQLKLDRPRFSFDKQGSRRRQQLALTYTHETTELVPHKRSTSYVHDLSLSTSSQPTNEKARISNVIAKLMGLEEIPLKEDSTRMKNDSKGKEGKQAKISRETNKSCEPLTRDSRNISVLGTNRKSMTNNAAPVRESKLQHTPEKNRETIKKGDQESGPFAANQGKAVVNEGKMLALNTEMQKKVENSKTLKAAHRRQRSIDQEASANSVKKRNANQQKPQDKRSLLQEQVPKIAEQDKSRAEQKGQQFQKQSLATKDHEGQQVESIIASKPKRSTATNGQKLSHDKSAPGNAVSIRSTEKLPMKDPLNRRQQDAAVIMDIPQKTAINQENFKKEDQSLNLSRKELEHDTGSCESLIINEKPIEVSVTQKRDIPRKLQKSEIPQKIDVLITRRNATANHLARSSKQPAFMLKGLKQQMHNKNSSSKRMEEQSDSKMKEVKTAINVSNVSELISEPVKLNDKLQNEDEQTFKLNTVADECKTQNILSLNDNCEVSDDHETQEQSCALKDEEEPKQCDQSIGNHEESTEIHDLSQHGSKQLLILERQEQLTEPEKNLKETIIKSQLFLSTAEALFKLNIPMSFLHAGEYNKEATEMKLVLECAQEVMKRKARRLEVSHHPYMKTTISSTRVRSLDDLVKQLCKDLEMLKFYGMNGDDECDVAAGLHKMLDNDIYDKNPDVNSMWDFEWSKMRSVFPEMEDVVKDVEKHTLNGLLDEITTDFLLITVSA